MSGEIDAQQEAIDAAGKSDAVILFLGLHSETGGLEGNEAGYAPDPCYATITYDKSDKWGHIPLGKLSTGTLHGELWCQAEVDVSIRPGWYWHESENTNVRSPENLMQSICTPSATAPPLISIVRRTAAACFTRMT